jgi:WD40 repeat protein
LKWIVSVSEDASLKIWDPGTGDLLCTLLGHAKGVNCVTILPDGKRAISGGSDNQVRLWDLDSRESKVLFVDNSPIHHIEVSKDSRWLACSNTGGLIWLFEWIQ